jgi:hypothetical protein
MSTDDAVTVCMHALYDAADDDSATGGPDLTRRIFPVVATVTTDGFRRLTEEEAGGYAQAVVDERSARPRVPPRPCAKTASTTNTLPVLAVAPPGAHPQPSQVANTHE